VNPANHPQGCGCPSCWEDRQLTGAKSIELTKGERDCLARLVENYGRAGGRVDGPDSILGLLYKLRDSPSS
jgi:hypothetical protein